MVTEMAGSVEHLAVAWELSQRWKDKIDYPEYFWVGNICPDGIMSRTGYQRTMKMHTHFRNEIPDYLFGEEDNLNIFHRRVEAFAAQIWVKEGRERELYLGYLTHILTDEIFMLTVRPEFMRCIEVLGLNQRMPETFEYFTYDVNQVDYRLSRDYPGMDIVYQKLQTIESYGLPGILTVEEMDRSRQWVLDFFFDQTKVVETPRYYTYDRAVRFIRDAVEHVENWMVEHGIDIS